MLPFTWLALHSFLAIFLAGIAAAQTPLAKKKHDRFPEFSWDRIPLYMHIRKATSYTPEELAFIAKFPLITFEKANGHLDHGSIEKGTLASARAVKKLNPKATILYYRNVIVHYRGYNADKALDKIPEAFLKGTNGEQKLIRSRLQAYDLSNENLRNWWTQTCQTMTADPAIDGIFLDGNIKALEPRYLAREIGPEKKQEVAAGYHQLMKQTRSAIGENPLMISNILRARFPDAGMEYLEYFDGSYLEQFYHKVGKLSYEEYLAKGIDAMQRASQEGKIVIFTSSLAHSASKSKMGIDEAHTQVKSDAEAQAGLSYPLAIFLIDAGDHSYFRPHEGYEADDEGRWMRWFKEYDKPLGPPLGPAKKDGFKYTRSFQHATVSLDLSKRLGKITWQLQKKEKR